MYYRGVERGDTLAEEFVNALKTPMQEKTFATTLETVDSAVEWYEEVCRTITPYDEEEMSRASLVFLELFMNAYEHGNLGIDREEKKRYLEQGIYYEKLPIIEQNSDAKISVKVYEMQKSGVASIATQICDEGKGFNLLQFIRQSKSKTNPNGRGIFVSRKNCNDIYYNERGNCVLFFIKEHLEKGEAL